LRVYYLRLFYSIPFQLRSEFRALALASFSHRIAARGHCETFLVRHRQQYILLFVPFGILSVWARAAGSTDRAGFFPILCTTLYGLLFATVIESGQTVAPGRDPSIRDALCNGMGAFIGAAWGSVLIRSYRKYLQTGFIRVLCRQPSLLLLTYLLCGILINSYFPFDVTLDLSSLWHNFKNSQLLPFRSMSMDIGLTSRSTKAFPMA